MKIIALGTFDIRYSFGLDDSVLEKAAIDNPENLDGLNITFPDGKSGFYVDNPLGQGITIKIPANHSLLSKWKNAANCIDINRLIEAEYPDFINRDDLETIKTKVTNFLKNVSLEVEINVLAIGVATISCGVNYTPQNEADTEATTVALLFFALEYSAYFADISNEIQDIIEKCLEKTDVVDPYIKEITKRKDPREQPCPFDSAIKCNDFLSCFTLVIEPEPNDQREARIAYKVLILINASAPDMSEEFNIYYYGVIRYGWAALSIEPVQEFTDKFAPKTCFKIFCIANLLSEAARAIDSLISDKFTRLLDIDINRKSLNKPEEFDFKFEEIALVRAIALFIVDRMSFRRVSQLKDIQDFLNRFTEDMNVKEYQDAIRQNSQSLYEFVRDMLEEKREERARVEEERAKNVQIILSGITALTVVSVASDVIGSVDFQGAFLDDKKWLSRTYWLLIIIPSVFLFMGLLTLLYSKATSIRERNQQNSSKKN